jgi:Protein of unknown function (DUF2637)
VSAGLDALDRGVIDAGLVAAEALSRVKALEAKVDALTEAIRVATRPAPPRAAPALGGSEAMTDRYRPLTAAAVLLVAAIAAVVSYMHVATLALQFGQEPLAAYLLPLSIDGMVATSSLVLLRSARAGVSAPWLARTGLVLAVMATLAANVASGLPHGWPGALLAGWPAVAFVISAETAIAMSRRRVAKVATERAEDTATPGTHARPRVARRPVATDTEAAIRATLATRPDITNAGLAEATGVSTRTARRYRTRLANGHPTE